MNEKLQLAGLTGNEAKVYLELTKKGQLTANQIAKNIGLDRTLTYTLLNNLIEKGQANFIIKENKKYFNNAPPNNLLNSLELKKLAVQELIKDLSKIKKQTEEKTDIKIYEGKEALRSIFLLFKKHKEMLAFGATGRAYDYLYESPALTKELVKSGMKGKIITSPKYANHPMTKVKTVQIKFLNFESEATTTLFGEYVMIHIAKEKPIIILIKNKDISDSY
ncbi:MAG: hypothetical protein KC506_01165, partial [Nanoarchaeota archaeon]|nr:hypothetical protein [Nanoarchaeota archaeon]